MRTVMAMINRFGDRMLQAVVPNLTARAATCNVQLTPWPEKCPYGHYGTDPVTCYYTGYCYRKYSRCSNGLYTLVCQGCNCSGCPCY